MCSCHFAEYAKMAVVYMYSELRKRAAACLMIVFLMEDEETNREKSATKQCVLRRKEKGAFTNIILGFKDMMRMSVTQFRELVDILQQRIAKQDTLLRETISASEQVALSIRFFATGESFRSLHYQFRISR